METFPGPPEFVPPPPPLPPPPVIAPQPAPKPRRSWGWIITSIVLFILLGFAGLIIIGQSVTRSLSLGHGFKSVSAREVGPKLDECILEDNDSRSKIAVITVDGIITSHTDDEAGNNMVDVIKAQLDRAADDDRVKAVILKVDSPGGEVMASDQIYRAIQNFETDQKDDHGKIGTKGKPVICSMGSLAASGGYYISAPCRWIVADELTLTASIGVIMHGYNYRGLMDKIGVAPMTYKSGKFKDMLSPDRATNEIPAEEHAMVQALITETYEKFKGIVYDGRTNSYALNKKEFKQEDDQGKELAPNWEDFADGRVVSGTQAYDLGLVDELGDFDDAVDRTLKIAHIKDANLVEYRERYDFGNFLSMFGQNNQAKTIKLDLGVDIPKLRSGCLYYLWQMPGH
ncbi:MAG TPA: signal peptide peptidase SppA [Candidatus Acidoferrales bacterium]|jgi:protease-4|nr:signal peptide peptidase SppA [Candidatus Acidoferrales bacterium]